MEKNTKPKSAGVYRIKCLQNGRFYVGQSLEVNSRFEAHLYLLKKGKHFNSDLQRDFEKYGERCFELEILEGLEAGLNLERQAKESQWIERLKATEGMGYNRAPGRKDFEPRKKNKLNRINVVLAELGRKKGWLADKLGISANRMSRICTNASQPTIKMLFKISDVLGVGIRELLERPDRFTVAGADDFKP